MKVKIKNGYLVIRIPLMELPPIPTLETMQSALNKMEKAPKEIVHTPECVQLRAREMIFSRQWPMHCRTCGAKGYIVNNATGQKLSCPRCLEFGLCSRCGNSALSKVSDEDGTFFHCPACEWDQRDAFSPAAELAGTIAPVWRCECKPEEE